MKNYELIAWLSKLPAGSNVFVASSCWDNQVRPGDALGSATTTLDERYLSVDTNGDIMIDTDAIDINIAEFIPNEAEGQP